MSRVIGIIQARMGSTRLPGKVLMEAAGKPLILHMLQRVQRCKTLAELWLATSVEPGDDVLASTVADAGYRVFRGSESDVLGRYHQLAAERNAEVVVRLTGDCPLHDPEVIDGLVSYFLTQRPRFEYASNTVTRTYPVGLDTEVFSMAALAEAAEQAQTPAEREHVTPYIRRDPATILQSCFDADFSQLRWTLDTAADYELIGEIFDRLYAHRPEFTWLDVLSLVTSEPRLITLNQG